MKKKLVDVLLLNKAMVTLEKGNLQFNPQGSIRYSRHRNTIQAFSKPFEDQVRTEFEKGKDRTLEAFQKAHDTVLTAINGEEVDLQLPPPVPVEWIERMTTPTQAEHEALAMLTDVVLGSPEVAEPTPA